MAEGSNKPLVYLLHKDTLLKEKRLPTFAEVKNELKPVYSWSDCPRYVYVSHKWLNKDHPDDALSTILSVLSLVVKTMRVIEYIWFDFSCSPVDEDEKNLFLQNLNTIISQSVRVLVIPFKCVGEDTAPVYDVLEFTKRAWCMLEACIFLKRPSKLRIAKIARSEQSFQLSMINLPSRNFTDGVSHLTDAYESIREMVRMREKDKFIIEFDANNEADKELIWNCLVELEGDIFSARRAESDFFVARGGGGPTSPTQSVKAVRGSNIYEPAVLKKLQTVQETEEKGNVCEACTIC
mmetsp:Transcript_12865/g.16793  ORF Transcript_12865/g.16793 Transcript_12865/m.16793 type:complete len:294 (-) Transcript_12865:339-1220(-)|eukprot:CAMPEP_0117754122 /NCGR_PEP_ID=MMETSP0947-20121206/12644_1 /TAXON_ID=44440 /ORGANISM="Chattonella subsalsa, Strain CCMP2191" /LENGTH=293 /DNA_ID=CAMNT_0005573157 /DNA_START=71 /DNA_END=952 /DNA_ORIENTATION=+